MFHWRQIAAWNFADGIDSRRADFCLHIGIDCSGRYPKTRISLSAVSKAIERVSIASPVFAGTIDAPSLQCLVCGPRRDIYDMGKHDR